jgi:hypothetical protein
VGIPAEQLVREVLFLQVFVSDEHTILPNDFHVVPRGTHRRGTTNHAPAPTWSGSVSWQHIISSLSRACCGLTPRLPQTIRR